MTTNTGENQADENQQSAANNSLFVPPTESIPVQDCAQQSSNENAENLIRSALLGARSAQPPSGLPTANETMNLPFHEAQSVNSVNGTTIPSLNEENSTKKTNGATQPDQDAEMTDETAAEEAPGTNSGGTEIPQEDNATSNGATEEVPSDNTENESHMNGATGSGGDPPNGGGSTNTSPNLEPPAGQIDLTVKDTDGNVTFFRIKRSTLLKKVFTAYAGQTRQRNQTLRFLFDGERLSGGETPDTLQMENGDIIDVFLEQIGGH